MAEKFDFEAALKAVQSGQSITGKDGVLGPLLHQRAGATTEGDLNESDCMHKIRTTRRS